MNVTVPKKTLEALASRVAVAADKKSTAAWHSRLLLRAAGRRLHVAAASADAEAFSSEDVSDEDCIGSCTTDAKDFCERVAVMPDGDVRLETRDSMLVIASVGTKRRFMQASLAGDDFKAQPLPAADGAVALPVADLRAALAVRAACSTDTAKVYNSVHLTLKDGTLVAAATDGSRLVELTRETSAPKSATLDAMVSLRSATILGKALAHLDSKVTEVKLWANGGPCTVELGGTSYRFFRPEGMFPIYAALIPKAYGTRLTLPRHALGVALKGMDIENKIPTRMRVDGMRVLLHCESPEIGTADDEVFVLGREGNAASDPFGVNSDFVLQAFAMATEVEATLAPPPQAAKEDKADKAPPAPTAPPSITLDLAASPALEAMKFVSSGAGWTLLNVVMPMRI